MIAPAGFAGSQVAGIGQNYTVASDGTITGVQSLDVVALSRAGWRSFTTFTGRISISSPLAADLVSIVTAVTPSNGALTIAAQPPHARKFQVRLVLGTPGTTNITAGTLTLVGFDQDGNAITEVVQMNQFGAVSGTYTTLNCYASLTSATVAGYTASGSGTGNTVGIGLATAFGLPTQQGLVAVDLAMVKSTKITKVLGTSNVAADDVASTGTLDTVARSFVPTTVPVASGLVDYEFIYNFGAPA
jgi:hypothetical protein